MAHDKLRIQQRGDTGGDRAEREIDHEHVADAVNLLKDLPRGGEIANEGAANQPHDKHVDHRHTLAADLDQPIENGGRPEPAPVRRRQGFLDRAVEQDGGRHRHQNQTGEGGLPAT